MLRQNVFAFTAYVVIAVYWATNASCATKIDPELRLLLQGGVNRGYPGVAMIIKTRGGKEYSAAAGYSNLEKHTPLRRGRRLSYGKHQ